MKKLNIITLAVLISGCNTSSLDLYGEPYQPYTSPSTSMYRERTPTQKRVQAEINKGFERMETASRDLVDSFSVELSDFLRKNSKTSAIARAKRVVAESLKDPGSAQFRNVRIVAYGQGSVICGEVNAKNSYGGYVGFKPFVASNVSFELERTMSEYAEINQALNTGLNEACG